VNGYQKMNVELNSRMKKTGIFAFTLFAGFAAYAMTLEEQVNDVLNRTGTRQEQMLRSMLAEPYPSKGMWRHEDFALAAYWLNERTKEADEGLITAKNELYPAVADSHMEGAFHWHAYLQARILFLFSSQSRFFPGRIGPEAEKAVLEMLWEWAATRCRKELAFPERVWWSWGSENHHAQAWVSLWSAAQIFKNHPDYQNRMYTDGSTPTEMAEAFDEYFKAYVHERVLKGLTVEVASPTYTKYTLNTWYNLADFADEPILKKHAGMLLDLYWADWAVEQIDGVRGGSRHRSYAGRASNQQSGAEGLAWYHFGLGEVAHKHPGAMGAATTFWRPSPIVVELALDTEGRGEYAAVSRRQGLTDSAVVTNFVQNPAHPLYLRQGVNLLKPEGGSLLRYTWCTPDFVMGMSQVKPLEREAWIPFCSQNRWNGVIFGGHPTARIFTQPLMPAKGSVYNAEWGVQNKGVMILQRLRTSNAKGQRIWFDFSLNRIETNGWVFVEAPQAYAAIRIARDGGVWQSDTIEQRRSGKGRNDIGEWLALKNEFSPVIVEVSRKRDYADFAAFRQAILANPFKWEGKTVEYRSEFYRTTLTLPVDAGRLPLVDGIPVNFEPEKVYDSPYITGGGDSGRVIIRKGNQSLTLDLLESKSR